MGLIRFENADGRGPSAALLMGISDWVNGSLAPQYGSKLFEDFSPWLGTDVGYTVAGTTGAAMTQRDDINGVARITADAGTNAEVGVVFAKAVVVTSSKNIVVEARFTQTDGAATDHIGAVGLTDQTAANILASNALAVSSNQDGIFLRWNTNTSDGGEFDLVAIEDGTLTVLVDNIVGDVARDAVVKAGFRLQVGAEIVRIYPAINGVVPDGKIYNMSRTDFDNVVAAVLRPALVVGAAANTTAPIADIDWFFCLDNNR